MTHRRILLFLLVFVTIPGHAQTWNEDFVNQPANLRYGSNNPTRIAYNAMQNFAVADVEYKLSRGDFHAIDQSGKANTLSVYIGGLRHVGKFDLQGHLRYHNIQDKDQAWNSTLWNNPYNPYILCDSVPGDASTEAFDMKVTASYPFSSRWKGGLELGIETGSRADQTDPRPRTSTSSTPITAGIDWQAQKNWHLGLTAGVRLFNSGIEYYNVQPLLNHRYFLMKGMGDYARRSTGDESGYKRDYKGKTYRAALEATWQPEEKNTANWLELGFTKADENATDGGTSYTFHGGDFSDNLLSLHDRFQWKRSSSTIHNFTLQASFANGKGIWYEQKRQTDMEHGGIHYYVILSKNANQKNNRMEASLRYQLDLLKEGKRDLFIDAQLCMHSLTRKQYLGDEIPTQKINLLKLDAKAGKVIGIRKADLILQAGVGYVNTLTDQYANGTSYTGTEDISDYTRCVFEYEAASNAHAGLMADVCFPAGKNLKVGLYIQGDCRFYTDDETYWQGYKSTTMTTMLTGAYLQF